MKEYKNVAPLTPQEQKQWRERKQAEPVPQSEPLDIEAIEDKIAAESRVRKLRGAPGTQEMQNAEELKMQADTGLSKENRAGAGKRVTDLHDSLNK